MEPAEPPNKIGESLKVFRHHLPHWQIGGSTYFVTFRSARGELSLPALRAMKQHLIAGHGPTHSLIFAVLMPDHVHLLLRPKEVFPGRWQDLGKIMQSIKGGGARRINIALGTDGEVWQKESFDRIIRSEADFDAKYNYMYENPKRAGLVDDPDDYPFFVRPPEE